MGIAILAKFDTGTLDAGPLSSRHAAYVYKSRKCICTGCQRRLTETTYEVISTGVAILSKIRAMEFVRRPLPDSARHMPKKSDAYIEYRWIWGGNSRKMTEAGGCKIVTPGELREMVKC